MDIHHLRVFISVFKHKSFSKASEELHLTQPTVSDHIKTIEDDFDFRLFDRLGRSIIPTKEAEVLYAHASGVLERMDVLREAIGKFRKEIAGEIVVGASTIPGSYLMPAIMASFRNRYPAIRLQVVIADSSAIAEKITRHDLLLGIVGVKPVNPQLEAMPFMEDHLIAVSSPSLIKEDGITLDRLTGYPMILREEGSGTRREVEKILDLKGYRLENFRIAGIFGSSDAIREAVKARLGFSFISRLAVQEELARGVLKQVKLKDIRMKRNFYIVTHKKRTLPSPYLKFMEHLKEESKRLTE
jgi:DNA-binding transcriptional LysR family regulator